MAAKKTVKTKVVRVTMAALLVVACVMWGLLRILGRLSLGDWLSFGQWAVDVLLIPAAWYGLQSAREELRGMTQKPELDLSWTTDGRPSGKELSLLVPQGSGKEVRSFMLALFNSGEAVTAWYMVRLTIPKELDPDQNPIAGDLDNNWRKAFLVLLC